MTECSAKGVWVGFVFHRSRERTRLCFWKKVERLSSVLCITVLVTIYNHSWNLATIYSLLFAVWSLKIIVSAVALVIISVCLRSIFVAIVTDYNMYRLHHCSSIQCFHSLVIYYRMCTCVLDVCGVYSYFECLPSHGLFAPLPKVEKLALPTGHTQ